MCRLYHIDKTPRELARQFGLRLDLPLPNFAPSWRIATTDPAPVLRRHPEDGERVGAHHGIKADRFAPVGILAHLGRALCIHSGLWTSNHTVAMHGTQAFECAF